jgi:protein-L-isoaspartate(D-aspartate) O-methyltransferase
MKKEIQQMLNTIAHEAKYTASYTGRNHFKKSVMQTMAKVPREKFVPADIRAFAYADNALPIGHGQTISQPYIVALMTDLLELTPECVVLEIGTGSGYQAAILSRLAKKVYTIERVSELHEAAEKLLKELGYDNIESRCSNGYDGWHEKAPFDAIIVTAAATYIPPALTEQLKPGGRMVIPVGLPYRHQELMLLSKADDGSTKTEPILAVAFVPLVVNHENLTS